MMSSAQWLEARGDHATCPVCKAAIDKEHLVPIYGRGNESREDPRYVYTPLVMGHHIAQHLMSWHSCDAIELVNAVMCSIVDIIQATTFYK